MKYSILITLSSAMSIIAFASDSGEPFLKRNYADNAVPVFRQHVIPCPTLSFPAMPEAAAINQRSIFLKKIPSKEELVNKYSDQCEKPPAAQASDDEKLRNIRQTFTLVDATKKSNMTTNDFENLSHVLPYTTVLYISAEHIKDLDMEKYVIALKKCFPALRSLNLGIVHHNILQKFTVYAHTHGWKVNITYGPPLIGAKPKGCVF